MMETCEHIQVNSRFDPTHTTSLRAAFVRDMSRRFGELTHTIRQIVIDDDVFGLRPLIHQLTVPGRRAFDFPRSADKLTAFEQWLSEQIDRGILQVGTFQQVGSAIEQSWMNRYILDTYKRGVMRARYEMKKAGMDVPTIETISEVDAVMGMFLHIETVGLLYTRAFFDLKGITTAMDTQISRVLAQGLADGDNPLLLARKLVATIDGTGMGTLGITDTLGRFIPAKRRAEMLARTEIIRAHHVATINEYRNWAVEGVTVQAEWMTAGDDRVCIRCADLQGQIFTLDEAEGMLPLHPNCRCVCLPHIVKE